MFTRSNERFVLLNSWSNDSPLFREEHVLVFTCLNYFRTGNEIKKWNSPQAKTFKRIKWLEEYFSLVPPFRGFPQASAMPVVIDFIRGHLDSCATQVTAKLIFPS